MMGKRKFKELLEESELSRVELARKMGIRERTTYWENPPKYVGSYLELYIKSKNAAERIDAFVSALKMLKYNDDDDLLLDLSNTE